MRSIRTCLVGAALLGTSAATSAWAADELYQAPPAAAGLGNSAATFGGKPALGAAADIKKHVTRQQQAIAKFDTNGDGVLSVTERQAARSSLQKTKKLAQSSTASSGPQFPGAGGGGYFPMGGMGMNPYATALSNPYSGYGYGMTAYAGMGALGSGGSLGAGVSSGGQMGGCRH